MKVVVIRETETDENDVSRRLRKHGFEVEVVPRKALDPRTRSGFEEALAATERAEASIRGADVVLADDPSYAFELLLVGFAVGIGKRVYVLDDAREVVHRLITNVNPNVVPIGELAEILSSKGRRAEPTEEDQSGTLSERAFSAETADGVAIVGSPETVEPFAPSWGSTCATCHGSNLVPSGTCSVCADCGTSSGCS